MMQDKSYGLAKDCRRMLIRDIEKFLKRTGMPPTKFGRLAAHDPRLVGDLRNGREPRPAMTLRVEQFMNSYRTDTQHAM